MSTFLITFAVFVAVIAAMAVGYIFQKKVVKVAAAALGRLVLKKYVTAQNHVMHVKSVRHVKHCALKS